MSLEEIKSSLASLPRKEQDEVVAFLFRLRHRDDADYHATITRRLDDKNPGHWMTPDEFEDAMEKREIR